MRVKATPKYILPNLHTFTYVIDMGVTILNDFLELPDAHCNVLRETKLNHANVGPRDSYTLFIRAFVVLSSFLGLVGFILIIKIARRLPRPKAHRIIPAQMTAKERLI